MTPGIPGQCPLRTSLRIRIIPRLKRSGIRCAALPPASQRMKKEMRSSALNAGPQGERRQDPQRGIQDEAGSGEARTAAAEAAGRIPGERPGNGVS